MWRLFITSLPHINVITNSLVIICSGIFQPESKSSGKNISCRKLGHVLLYATLICNERLIAVYTARSEFYGLHIRRDITFCALPPVCVQRYFGNEKKCYGIFSFFVQSPSVSACHVCAREYARKHAHRYVSL